MSTIQNKIHQRALQTMIETYGQTPLQLFQNPHPKRFSKQSSALMDIILTPKEPMVLNSMQKDKVKPSVPETNQGMFMHYVFVKNWSMQGIKNCVSVLFNSFVTEVPII